MLTPEQIENWRRIIFMQLEERAPGAGIYASIMPEAEVIEYWKKMKTLLESPRENNVVEQKPTQNQHEYRKSKKCDHKNSITGQNGTYCLDCEEYV